MPSSYDAKEFNASFNPSYIPVVIITGGTAGVGQAMEESLSPHLHGRIHLILVGRNRVTAEAIINTLPIAPPEPGNLHSVSKYEFFECDVTKMRNVWHAMADDPKKLLTRVNFLVHCAGVPGLHGWKNNGEGMDVKLASRYYSRWALTYDLLPLLRHAKKNGGAASVLSVLGAGYGYLVDSIDIGLKRTYTGYKAMFQSGAYNDLMVVEFARREPDIAFTHTGPGFVNMFK